MQDFVGFRIPLWLRRLATMLPAVVVVAMGVDSTWALVLQPGRAEPGAAGADDRAVGAGRAPRRHGCVRHTGARPRLGAVVAAVLVLALNLLLLLQTAGVSVDFSG